QEPGEIEKEEEARAAGGQGLERQREVAPQKPLDEEGHAERNEGRRNEGEVEEPGILGLPGMNPEEAAYEEKRGQGGQEEPRPTLRQAGVAAPPEPAQMNPDAQRAQGAEPGENGVAQEVRSAHSPAYRASRRRAKGRRRAATAGLRGRSTRQRQGLKK